MRQHVTVTMYGKQHGSVVLLATATQILTDQQIQQFSEMFLGLRNGHKQFHSSVTQLCQAVMLLLKRANLMQRQRRA